MRSNPVLPGFRTTQIFNAAGQNTATMFPDGKIATYAFDKVGRRTTMVDWGGTSTYAFDALGRQSGQTDAAGFVDGAGMKRRAYEIAGKAASVRDVEEMGTFTVLLGNPRRVDAEKHFLSAKRIWIEAPGEVRVIEESQAESFANDLEREMREHGVLS